MAFLFLAAFGHGQKQRHLVHARWGCFQVPDFLIGLAGYLVQMVPRSQQPVDFYDQRSLAWSCRLPIGLYGLLIDNLKGFGTHAEIATKRMVHGGEQEDHKPQQ